MEGRGTLFYNFQIFNNRRDKLKVKLSPEFPFLYQNVTCLYSYCRKIIQSCLQKLLKRQNHTYCITYKIPSSVFRQVGTGTFIKFLETFARTKTSKPKTSYKKKICKHHAIYTRTYGFLLLAT